MNLLNLIDSTTNYILHQKTGISPNFAENFTVIVLFEIGCEEG